ncbi:MAG: hypothetical protein KDI15_13400, partial [Thiothrix sp.]|nr:hypothetical protein [Thiothrix sp.]
MIAHGNNDCSLFNLLTYHRFGEGIVNQWDYANKKQLSQTAFDGIQVEKVYLADQHFLLRNKNMF